MPISPVANNAAMTNTRSSKMGTGELGQDDFFQLMIDQLKNQNPLSPQDNSEFLSQMVQFSTMDKLTDIGNRMAMNEAFQLIGKVVVAQCNTSEGLQNITGEVKSVLLNGDKPMLEVGDTFVSLDSVMLAAAPEPVVETNPDEEVGDGGENPEAGEGEGEGQGDAPVEGTESV